MICSNLFLNDPTPKFSLLCAYEDCRHGLRWAEKMEVKNQVIQNPET